MHGARPALLLIAVLALPLPTGCGAGGDPKVTTRPINIMVPAAPGGGWDQAGRAMQAAFSQSTGRRARVYNVPGAGGTIGLAQFVSDHEGDPHQLMVGGLVMLGFIRTNNSPVTLEQVTPVASLIAEWQAVVVPEGSKYRTFRQLIEDFKKNPAGVSWGGGSAGGADHLLAGLIAQAAGVEPAKVNYVAHAGGGEMTIAVLSGAVTVGVTGVSEARDQVEAGRLRWLAVSSDQRIAGVDAPTIREAGLEVTLANWRGVFAPPGLSGEQRAAVISAVEKMRGTEEWKQALRKYDWSDFFKTGDEFSAFLDGERARLDGLKLEASPGGFSVVGPQFFPLLVVVGLIALGAIVVHLGLIAPLKRQNQGLRLIALVAILLLRLTLFPRPTPATGGAGERTGKVSAEVKTATDWLTVGLTALALVAYGFALRPLGYILATAVFFPAAAWILGSRRPRRDIGLGVALGGGIYLVFTCLLEIQLPGGWWVPCSRR